MRLKIAQRCKLLAANFTLQRSLPSMRSENWLNRISIDMTSTFDFVSLPDMNL